MPCTATREPALRANQSADSYASGELLLVQLGFRLIRAKKFTQRILLIQLTFTIEMISFSKQ
jgi:hypothetical protein